MNATDTEPAVETSPADGPPAAKPARFDTFSGVFRPVALTILGAMLYLREGWVVGEAGLLGALLVIAAAYAITGTTALSLASIASNVRVKPGGAFAIIAQALGLEAGGAIGIPLFIAQAASAAMYIYAFAEAWAYLFPAHSPMLVAGVGFAGVALLAWRGSGLAVKTQGVMVIVVAAALTSAALGLVDAPLHRPTLLGAPEDIERVGLLTLFAIFFPAATGIMVGAGMSGSLENPRRSIPRGTLLAWGTTLVIYSGFAVWYSLIASPEDLVGNKTLIIERAAVPALVLIGLLSSTLMAALSSLVAAPKLLQAMAAHGVVPGHRWLAKTTAGGEARNAVLATTGFAGLGLAAGSLDAIAPVITSFFVMTYMAINAVVTLEQQLGMISFRPAFRVPTAVPLVGLGLCLVALSVSSPFGGVLEILFVLAVYAMLSRQNLQTPWETVRSGVAVTLAAWAARKASHIEREERSWKPDLLVPVASRDQMADLRELVESLARRNGSIRWMGLGDRREMKDALPRLSQLQARDGLHVGWTHIRSARFMEAIGVAMDALHGDLFPPNLVLVDRRAVTEAEIAEYLTHCRDLSVGLALWLPHPDGRLGAKRRVDVWLSDRSPDWTLQLHVTNLDLPVLVGLLLAEAWGATLRLRTVVRDPTQAESGRAFLKELIDQARLPPDTEVLVGTGNFVAALGAEPRADLHLLGIPPVVSAERLDELRDAAGASCLWLMDSGRESALA